jgi:hypothetical protein
MPAKKDAPIQLAQALVRVLREQRQQGGGTYPLTLRCLGELAAPQADPKAVVQAASPRRKAFCQFALAARNELAAPVALVEDLPFLAGSPLLLEYALEASRTATNQALSPARLKAKLAGKLQKPFQEAVNRRLADDSLPPPVGWIWVNRSRCLFLVKDLHLGRAEGRDAPTTSEVRGQRSEVRTETIPPLSPGPAPPPPAMLDFNAAFERLDRQAGGHNFVSLVDLRQALPLDRLAFDAELRRLRLAGRYTLSAAEGRHGLTAAEQEAGISEDGALLLFVSRKAP